MSAPRILRQARPPRPALRCPVPLETRQQLARFLV